MTTRLDAQFLRAIALMGDFKPGEMRRVKAALLALAVNGLDFTAADLPAEVANGDIHLAGAACGSLVVEGLIQVVARKKSPDPKSKGRKLNVFRLSTGKANTVRAWFAAQQLVFPQLSAAPQMEMIAA